MPEAKMGDIKGVAGDLAQAIRLALKSEADGMRLFAARLVRKYKQSAPHLSEEINGYLRDAPAPSPMRRASPHATVTSDGEDSDALALLKVDTAGAVQPALADTVKPALVQLLAERRQSKKLQRQGLEPLRSAIFVGPPGVGKTMTAKWIAAELELPLYVLDLTAIMSSYLGRSGNNLRAVLDFAKGAPCVLLLDEIDAIAKRRGDMSDVGELKRLVTVMLQEIDAWPATSLLLAATNHAELIDPALWRRFDMTVDFPAPSRALVASVLDRLFADDAPRFETWLPILVTLLEGQSFSDIDRLVRQFRKAVTLRTASPVQLVEDFVARQTVSLERSERQRLAKLLVGSTRMSQHKISDLTGVSRDTIRKYKKEGEDGQNGD